MIDVLVGMTARRTGYRGSASDIAMALAADVATLKRFRDEGGLSGAESYATDVVDILDEAGLDQIDGDEVASREEIIDTRYELVVQAVDRLRTLEGYFKEAFDGVWDGYILMWSLVRLPMKQSHNDFGQSAQRPYHYKEAAQHMWSIGERTSYGTVRRRAMELDEKIVEVLVKHGEADLERDES